ncbi:Sec-independent protein translocase subunit TatA [Streptomyces rimosus]
MLRNGLEPWHLLIVALVVILLFGSKKLPDTARALGKSLRILKSETKAMKDEAPEGEGTGVVVTGRASEASGGPGAPGGAGAPSTSGAPGGR